MSKSTNSRDTVAGVAVPTSLFINGAWRQSNGGRLFDVADPATGKVIATVSDADTTDAEEALAAAAQAQQTWGLTSPRERAAILLAAFYAVQAKRHEIAAVITAEMGRPLAESLAEVDYGAEFLRWFAEQTAHVHGDYGPSPSGAFRVVTTKVPVGPSLLITPWNFPLAMGTRKIGAALAAGCTVILKPAAQTPLTAALLVEILADVGVPDGVVNLIPTNDAGGQSKALMNDARLRKVSFTGSTTVGSVLLRQAADHVLKSSMELGGNGPFLVLHDADVDAAVDGAMIAKFRNGGQSCVAANRFIVHKNVADRFTAELADRTAALKVGEGTIAGVGVGPLIDARQRDKVHELVADAVQRGARALCGGSLIEGEGYFYAPTVLADVPSDARINHEEIFGPVAPITVVESDEEAIRLANDTPYGLAAFVYTGDGARAFTVAERLEAGMIGINRGLVSEAGAPFGGIKASGLGREGGHLGIEEYLETKYFALDLTVPSARNEGAAL
ncbi:NAD-dependent succinate-semialdehyde dehydrogenase [Pseudarthrobacter sp. SSS035]|uniref:NAD-dependent succinate-semialdehyde dehydrogenase n=1 Tax=Pseudarthrobacter sp. SSS035 TaxID=2931399 RepID=UPI00200C1D97|nr:NAD-dependent succinate-semialdehyde dehydrogenase [Pseudarthrobacter sp. SSS035]